MATDKNLRVVISAEDNTKKGIQSAEKNLGGLGSAAKKLGVVLAGAFAVGQIVAFGRASVEAATEAARAHRQLEHAVIAVSKGTREQVQAVSDLSDALQRKAGIDGDALKAGVAQLSTFGLQSDTVVKLTKSLADLTVNQNGVNASADQYIGSANMIAKVLRGQFGVLEKSGIRFTEAQQAMIQYGTETERVTAIQEGLNQNLRETTDTIGNSAEGAMARFQRAWGEIQESIGNILLPLMAKVAEAMVPIANAVQAFVDGFPDMEGIKKAWEGFLTMIEEKTGLVTFFKDAWQNVSDVIQYTLWPALQELWVALQPYQPFFEALAKVFGTMLVIALAIFIKTLEAVIILAAEFLATWAKVQTFLAEKLGPIFDWIGDKIAKVTEAVIRLIDKLKSLDVLGGLKNSVSKIFGGGRAVGGPVTGNRPYLVGENGPEIFTPQGYGRITPNNKLGSSIVINISGNSFMGKEGIAREIGEEILRMVSYRTKLTT